MSANNNSPKEILIAGSEIIGGVLIHHGFVFKYRGDGQGSGGHFAWGEFVRGDRRLELHYREGLGLVAYHIGDHYASHEAYMRELGALGKNRYPGYNVESLNGFRDLAADLALASDFVSGDASVLRAAARKENEAYEKRSQELMSDNVGDTDRLRRMRELFRQRLYAEILSLYAELQFPDRLTEAQKQFVKLARERAGR